nr:unnamed protein product [Digitaria exilis]
MSYWWICANAPSWIFRLTNSTSLTYPFVDTNGGFAARRRAFQAKVFQADYFLFRAHEYNYSISKHMKRYVLKMECQVLNDMRFHLSAPTTKTSLRIKLLSTTPLTKALIFSYVYALRTAA